jgi:NhaC family Na+:H+ antiporter
MDFLIALIIFTASLIFSIARGISILVPLVIGLICFMAASMHKGFKLKEVLDLVRKGMAKALIVIRIFILIGIITAVWRSCGTIPYFVYYGTKIINPEYFILFSFFLSCAVSFTLGTSFGTVGTIGIVLMVLAKSGGVDIRPAAGAIIAGAYFGDRCAPTSSSANLIAAITGTEIYDNVKSMLKTGILPFVISIVAYFFISKTNPLKAGDSALLNEIPLYFNLNALVLVPAALIFILALFRVNVKISMLASIASGIIISLFVQGQETLDVIKTIIIGFRLEGTGELPKIISGGGLISMIKVSLIVLIASSYSGIFEETGMLEDIQKMLEKMSRKAGVYFTTIVTSAVTASFFCNQTLSSIMTHQLMKKIYEEKGYSKSELAIDLENTVIMISALIPWNIAVAVPLATLSADEGSIIYALYIYLVPLLNMIRLPKKIKAPGI